eukprot:g3848.t1
MKLAVGLLLVFVAPTASFVPSTSCRGAITASRTRSTTAVVAVRAQDDEKDSQETAPKDKDDSEPRKAFSAAPTFEEFLKFKQAERGETELKIP